MKNGFSSLRFCLFCYVKNLNIFIDIAKFASLYCAKVVASLCYVKFDAKKVVASLSNVKVVAHEQTLDKAQLSKELNKSRERITHFQAICEGVKAKESFHDKIPSFIQLPATCLQC